MQVFISYASSDLQRAEAIYAALRSLRQQPVLDRRDVHEADAYDARLLQLIRRCSLVVFLASDAALNGDRFARAELAVALQEGRRVLPVIDDDSQAARLPATLRATALRITGEAGFQVAAAVDRLARQRRRRQTIIMTLATGALAASAVAAAIWWRSRATLTCESPVARSSVAGIANRVRLAMTPAGRAPESAHSPDSVQVIAAWCTPFATPTPFLYRADVLDLITRARALRPNGRLRLAVIKPEGANSRLDGSWWVFARYGAQQMTNFSVVGRDGVEAGPETNPAYTQLGNLFAFERALVMASYAGLLPDSIAEWICSTRRLRSPPFLPLPGTRQSRRFRPAPSCPAQEIVGPDGTSAALLFRAAANISGDTAAPFLAAGAQQDSRAPGPARFAPVVVALLQFPNER